MKRNGPWVKLVSTAIVVVLLLVMLISGWPIDPLICWKSGMSDDWIETWSEELKLPLSQRYASRVLWADDDLAGLVVYEVENSEIDPDVKQPEREGSTNSLEFLLDEAHSHFDCLTKMQDQMYHIEAQCLGNGRWILTRAPYSRFSQNGPSLLAKRIHRWYIQNHSSGDL